MTTEAVAGSLFSWVDAKGNTQTLDVDVVMSASDKRSMKLTDHVVEDGSTITDHIVLLPESISMELLVTQTPFPNPNQSSVQTTVGTSKRQDRVRVVRDLKIPQNNFQPGGFLLLSTGARKAIGAVSGALLGAVGLGSTPQNRFEGSDFSGQKDREVKLWAYVAEERDYVSAVHDKLIEIMTGALRVTVSFKGRLYIDYLLTEVELNQSFGSGRFKVEARALSTVTGTPVKVPNPSAFDLAAKVDKGKKNTTTPKPAAPQVAESLLSKGGDKAVAYVDKTLGLKP